MMASQVLLLQLQQQHHHQITNILHNSNLHDALDSCSSMAQLQQLHSQVIRLGLSSDNHTIGRIVKKLCLNQQQSSHHHHHSWGYALQVFHRIPKPDVFLYNTIFNGYLMMTTGINVDIRRSILLQLYSKMLHCSVCPNHFTFPSLLRACCVSGAAEEGKQLHAHVFKFGHGDDVVAQNNLMHMYVNHGHLEKARRVFDGMPARDAVSWTTLISGYAGWGRVDDAHQLFLLETSWHGKSQPSAAWNAMIAAFVQSNRVQEAFALFARMREEEVAVDKYVAATMLSACAALGAVEQGIWIHGYIERSRMEVDGKVATSIIDMYCRCGCLDKALQVFNALEEKGVSSWNCMIGGLALHGRPEAAMELFKEMERGQPTHPRPDAVTMVNVLTACAHAGLLAEGRRCFRHMIETYGMEPGLEHYGCMVDLLGRAGLVEEAKMLVQEMPMGPDAAVLGALLGACKIHGDVDLGAEVGKQLLEMEPENSGRYVLLANLYASAGRWDEVAGVRKLMEERGVKKTPGCSVVQLHGSATEFIAGDPRSMEISCMVHEMLGRIKPAGYVPDVEEVLHDLGDGEGKDDPLHYHSEKLAVAYGLLNTSAGATIRISKNLRVCKDCHSACKLISQVFDRKIVMRDRNRFHHFEGGTCSCNDFW